MPTPSRRPRPCSRPARSPSSRSTIRRSCCATCTSPSRRSSRSTAMPEPTETKQLPAEFADSARFSDWILATEPERYARRLASSMPEMQDLYDTVFPRLQDALDYVEKYDWDDLPDEPRHLFHLLQSLVMVSFPVEVLKQPRVPDSGAAYLNCIKEP